jgi:hypothetical protein
MKKLSILVLFIMIVLSACGNKETIQENTVGTNDQKQTDEAESENKEEVTTEEDLKENETEETEDQKDESLGESDQNKDVGTTKREVVKIEIKDESTKNSELAEFMKQLKKVVADKNTESLLSMMIDDIKFSFGLDNGKEGFIKKWGLEENPKQSELWKELQDALSQGGSLSDNKIYTAPYIFGNFPEGYDHFQYGAILGENVNVREKASSDSNTVIQLSYEVVEMVGEFSEDTIEIDGDTYRWVKIRTLDGKSGYVAEKYVRNPVDYRVGVEQQMDGTWKIVFFIAGD